MEKGALSPRFSHCLHWLARLPTCANPLSPFSHTRTLSPSLYQCVHQSTHAVHGCHVQSSRASASVSRLHFCAASKGVWPTGMPQLRGHPGGTLLRHPCLPCSWLIRGALPTLQMTQDQSKVIECTTSRFDGLIAMIHPESSWVAKWNRIGASKACISFPDRSHYPFP